MTAILIQQVPNLIALLGLLFIAVGLGRLVLFGISLFGASSGEDFIFGAGIGLGILSCAVFILGATRLIYPFTVYPLLGIFGILSLSGWWVSPNISNRAEAKKVKWTVVDVFIGALLLICLLLGLMLVLTPAIGNDVLTYHLGAPKLYLKEHGFYLITGNLCSNYPLNTEMLYILGLLLGGDAVAKGIHFGMAVLTLASMVQFSKNLVPGAIYIPISLLVFYSIPSVFINSHMAYVDLALTFYTFLSIYSFLNWLLRKQLGWLVICGVFTGLSVATK